MYIWGGNTTKLCGDFHKPLFLDPYEKQPGFNGNVRGFCGSVGLALEIPPGAFFLQNMVMSCDWHPWSALQKHISETFSIFSEFFEACQFYLDTVGLQPFELADANRDESVMSIQQEMATFRIRNDEPMVETRGWNWPVKYFHHSTPVFF